MPRSSKRLFESLEPEPDERERIPLSPITSPPLTKRQEQNRAAQRAFRERRAQTLKEMEIRLGNLEKTLSENVTRINSFERDLIKLKEIVQNLCVSIDTLTVPTWTVPTAADEIKQNEPEAVGAVLNALRPSSTDPTLLSN